MEDTVSVSSLHIILMTSFPTAGPEPIELVERVETAGAAQG